MNSKAISRIIIYSSIGIFMFFVPFEFAGRSSIALDHIVSLLREQLPIASNWAAILLIAFGAVHPFASGNYRNSISNGIMSAFKLCGLTTAIMYISGSAPDILMAPGMLPFLFEKLVVPVGLIVPVGAIFLSFLVGYGLLEFIGVLLNPIMRPLFATPGRSAIDAVASFVGSYSIGLLITDRVYRNGNYTAREAAIIATGFSTVSATFMIIVAGRLGLMEIWNTYFWTTLLITFFVTAITVRIYPLRSFGGPTQVKANTVRGNNGKLIDQAISQGLKAADSAPSLAQMLRQNIADGLRMASAILPSIMSIGLLGLLLAEHTPVFEWMGWIFRPIMLLLQVPGAAEASGAVSVGLVEMFLPALTIEPGAPIITRYIVGVVSVSTILFFSASIPCIMATSIPVKTWQLVIIWLWRAILSIILAALTGMLLF